MQCTGKKTSDVSSRVFFFFFFWCVYTYMRASLVVLVHKGCEFDPWVGKISWRRPWQPIPVFLPGKISWTEEPGGLQYIESQKVGYN